MKILLISPSVDPESKTPKGLMIPQLSLHILEGLTPPAHEVKILEEEMDDISLEEECDLVGISCMTANAPRAYALSAEFRKRGKTVVLGGVHPTLLFNEAIQHCDAVVVGEAENVWEQLLEDFQRGALKRRYHHPATSLDRYIHLKYRKNSKKRLFDVIPIMTTRGCPYHCVFCCVSHLYGNNIRHVPIENVVRDLAESQNRNYLFLDDNLTGDPQYAKALFRAIKPFKIKWAGQASISIAYDPEMMRLAADSGCAALFFGVESVSERQLRTMEKSIKNIMDLEEAIKRVKERGIHFHASLVFGFDTDTKDIFQETLDFLMRNKIGTASFNILTPYPGTRIYNQFKREGRLLTTNWKYYDHSTVVFQPKNMTPYELQTGTIQVKKEFSGFTSILRRLPGNLSHPLLYLLMNRGIRKNVAADIRRLPHLMSEVFGIKPCESGFASTSGDTGLKARENLQRPQTLEQYQRLEKGTES
ncbi:B12-binding domain-containing radical SAM protein [Candidatus Sumerlaeota bacterium]|nr:B12-binding domain-containing radical SAM protein [Candidatus Sumerlaeota bacterium]